MQESCIKAVSGADSVNGSNGARRNVPFTIRTVGRRSSGSAFDNEQPNARAQLLNRYFYSLLMCKLAGFTFIGHQYIHKLEGINDATIPQAGGVVIGVEGDGDAFALQAFKESGNMRCKRGLKIV